MIGGLKGQTFGKVFRGADFADAANRYYHRTYFDKGIFAAVTSAGIVDSAPEIDRDWDLTGTNGTYDLTVDGIALSTSDTAQNDQAVITPHFVDAINTFNMGTSFYNVKSSGGYSRQPYIRWIVSLASSVTDVAFNVGFGKSSGATTGGQVADLDDKAAIGFDSATAGTIHYVVSNNGTDTVVQTSQTMTAGKTYLFEIFIDGAYYPHFYINGDYVGKGALLDSAEYFAPFAAIQDLSAAATNHLLALVAMEYSRFWDHTIDVAPPGGTQSETPIGEF